MMHQGCSHLLLRQAGKAVRGQAGRGGTRPGGKAPSLQVAKPHQ